MTGWEGDKQLHSGYRSSKPDSPGYTDKHREQMAQLRSGLMELSIAVTTHPYWESLSGPQVVAVRMALKHAHEQLADADTAL